MLADEWAPTVGNVAKMLGPGGLLQWEECDLAGVKHFRGAQGSRADTVRRLGHAFRDGLLERFEHGWNTLTENMGASGLVSVIHDFVSSDRLPGTRERVTVNGVRAMLSSARLMTLREAPRLFFFSWGNGKDGKGSLRGYEIGLLCQIRHSHSLRSNARIVRC